MTSFYGTFTCNTLPANFTDTINSLEFKINVLRDTVLPVDDLVVRANSNSDESLAKAVSLIRGVGNGAAKGRMKRDLTARAERPANPLVITTERTAR